MDERRKAETDAQVDKWAVLLLVLRAEMEKFMAVPAREKAWLAGEAELVVRYTEPVFSWRQVGEELDEPGGQYPGMYL